MLLSFKERQNYKITIPCNSLFWGEKKNKWRRVINCFLAQWFSYSKLISRFCSSHDWQYDFLKTSVHLKFLGGGGEPQRREVAEPFAEKLTRRKKIIHLQFPCLFLSVLFFIKRRAPAVYCYIKLHLRCSLDQSHYPTDNEDFLRAEKCHPEQVSNDVIHGAGVCEYPKETGTGEPQLHALIA